MAKRVYARVSDEVAEKVVMYSGKYGLTQSQLYGMAIQAGLGAIIRAINPEDVMTPEQWAKLVKAYEDEKGKECQDVDQLRKP